MRDAMSASKLKELCIAHFQDSAELARDRKVLARGGAMSYTVETRGRMPVL